jgi:glycosyltransferase involved in cell wall biosynthesis
MLNGKRIVVVMPAYLAGRTLQATWRDLPHEIVDEVLVVDDSSDDDTVSVARSLNLDVILHPYNKGYGGNQKTCYNEALARRADVIVMVHPDYQYDPRMVTAMAGMVASGVYDIVIGSRMLGGGALAGGMPVWKYAANRILTAFENVLIGGHLSEYHSGYRAYSRALLDALPWQSNSDNFVFDNEILAQAIIGGFSIGEVSVPTRYFPEASSIDFRRSVRYGMGVVRTTMLAFLARTGLFTHRLFTAGHIGRDSLPVSERLSREREKLVAAPDAVPENGELQAMKRHPQDPGAVEQP